MRSPFAVVSSELGLVLAILVTGSIYIAIASLDQISLWLTAVIKVLPILCLCAFVLNRGLAFLLGHHSVLKLLFGLVFSGVGDVFLVPSKYFILGGAMFGIAHCFYIWTFGFQPLNLRAGGAVGVVVGAGATLLVSCLRRLEGTETWQTLALCGYCTVIGAMVWRANSRILFHSPRTPAAVLGGVGAACFAVSDFTLALNLLCVPHIPYRTLIVMSTYYSAQLFITLSVVSDQEKSRD